MKNTWYINIICTKFTSQNVSYVPSLLHKLKDSTPHSRYFSDELGVQTDHVFTCAK